MKRSIAIVFATVLCACPAFAQSNTGTIKGHVRLMGTPPGNPIIRMGMDPMCSRINAGSQAVQEVVAVDDHGNLANAFLRLQGNFPKTPVPSQPVVIDQRRCIFSPRVVGMRVGQTLELKNDDPITHNVHSMAKGADSFNASTPAAGTPFLFKPKQEEVMLRVGCDFHRWMVTYVGVVTNPYFAVSGKEGAFEIDNVPPGTYTIQSWHEAYGPLMKTVTVTAGGTTSVDFAYKSSTAQPAKPTNGK
jgi:plastocyanin